MNTPDDPAARQLRHAHELLDEQPGPAVRDAVLRAAAARPVTAPADAPKESAARPWWRIPLPLAGLASATVAVLAVGVAVHLQAPREVAIPPLAESTPPAAPVGGAAVAGAAPAAPPRATMARATAKTAIAADAAPAEAAPPAAADRASGDARGADAATMASANVAPRIAMAAPGAHSAAAPPASGPAAAPLPPASEPTAVALADGNAPADAARAAASQRAAPAPAYRAAPQAWLDRILELRRAHRDREADQELGLLRAAHPALQIPPAALPR